MIYKIVFVIALFFLNTGFIIPQQIRFQHLGEEEGLAHLAIKCVLEDRTGFIWFGTENGLNRFDNYSFRLFQNTSKDTNSLSDNNVWCLLEDLKGNIWVGTQGGILNCFDPATEKFKHYKITHDQNLGDNSITCLYEGKNGNLWIGTYNGGLYRLDLTSGKIQNWQSSPDAPASLSNKFVTSLYEDPEGNIWVGTYNGLCVLNKNMSGFTQYFHNPSNSNSITHNIIWKIYPSKFSQDHIWIGTYNGITLLELKNRKFTQIIPDQNNPDKFCRSVSSICEDFNERSKVLWVGTYQGLLKIDLTSVPDLFTNPAAGNKGRNLLFTRWVYNSKNPFSLNNNHISNLLLDRSGVLWISGEDGIDFYPRQKDKFSFKFANDVLEAGNKTEDGEEIKNVQAICNYGPHSEWFGTNSGLYSITGSPGQYQVFRHTKFDKINIWSLSTGRDNDLWIGSYGNGLKHLDLTSGKVKTWKGNWFDTSDIGNSYVRSVFQDNSGHVWLGFWGVGVNRLDPETGRIERWYHSDQDSMSLSYDDVWVIFQDKRDRIWIGTYGGGLNLFNPADGGKFYRWSGNEHNSKGLTNNNILSISEAGKEAAGSTVLWVGTTQGLNKLIIQNGNSGNPPKVETADFPGRDLLMTRTINGIIEDDKNFLWISTLKGLIKFDPAAGTLEEFTSSDGLRANQFNPNAAYRSASGEVFLGSIGGIDIFRPDSIKQSDYKAPVVFTEFLIFNRKVDIGPSSPLRTSIGTSKEILLSYDQNVFSIQFAALDYNASQETRYAYIMDGFDDDWIYSGTRHFVTYTNLFPGTYHFKVKATNSDGIWNNSPASITIRITPPYWQSWWFRGLIILLITASLYLLYRIRVKRLLELEKLRIKIASDLHDDIGSALSRISIESELINTNSNPDGRSEALKRIGQMSRDIVSSMSDVIWSIDSRNDTIEDMINRMKDFSFSLFALKDTNVKFETSNLELHKKIKVDIRQNIYLIFKEAINNAAKYSASGSINILLSNYQGRFIMIIDDPAAEFNPTKLTGQGLKNMEMRAARIGGTIEFIRKSGLRIILTSKEI